MAASQKYLAIPADDADATPAGACCRRWDEAPCWDVVYHWATPLVSLGARRNADDRKLEHSTGLITQLLKGSGGAGSHAQAPSPRLRTLSTLSGPTETH